MIIGFEDKDSTYANLLIKLKHEGITKREFFRGAVSAFLDEDPKFMQYILEFKKKKNLYTRSKQKVLDKERKVSYNIDNQVNFREMKSKICLICLTRSWVCEMKECANECVERDRECSNKECRLWIKHKEDYNCTLLSIEKHGVLTLHQVGTRLNLSYARIKQIQDVALKKIDKEEMRNELFVLDDGFF